MGGNMGNVVSLRAFVVHARSVRRNDAAFDPSKSSFWSV